MLRAGVSDPMLREKTVDAEIVTPDPMPVASGLPLTTLPAVGVDRECTEEAEAPLPKQNDIAPVGSSGSATWDAIAKNRNKGKWPKYQEDGPPATPAIGFTALEPSEKKGAALRNVTTVNGNFLVVEGVLRGLNDKLEELKSDTLKNFGATVEKLNGMDSTFRQCIAPLSRANTGPRAPDVKAILADFFDNTGTREVARANESAASPIVVTDDDDDDSGGEDDSEAEAYAGRPTQVKVEKVSRQAMLKVCKLSARPGPGRHRTLSDSKLAQKPSAKTAVKVKVEQDVPQPPVTELSDADILEAKLQSVVDFLEQESPATRSHVPRGVFDSERRVASAAPMHALAALMVPRPGSFVAAAPPALIMATDPKGARIGMLQGRVYDLLSKNGGRFLPELFIPPPQPSFTAMPPAPSAWGDSRSTAGFKRARDDQSDGEDKAIKRPLDLPECAHEESLISSVLRIGPWNFPTEIRDIRTALNGMFATLPNSHLIKGLGCIMRCADKTVVVVSMKTLKDANTLVDAWEERGHDLRKVKLVRWSQTEVLHG
ncbi:hypothetical protein AURDEDRAFT_159826 [Auricularia subglabra TFB-10046 SS5]|nr:hypothetical protein AURDEDRAFT_159826 [Auricularia subglabra TFB-10046 SS5]